MSQKFRINRSDLDSIKWILFDLDNTLWDFDKNANEALKELFHRHKLEFHTGYQVDQFIHLYEDVNNAYWAKYEKGEVSKEVLRTRRFTDTFEKMGLQPALYPKSVWQEYLDICPVMTEMIPGALETLNLLKPHFSIGILTNGFEVTQSTKLKCSGIEPYIDYFQSSERIGIAKPSGEFFKKALMSIGVKEEEVLYIGDNWKTDVQGGIDANIKTFHYLYESSFVNKTDGYSENKHFMGHVNDLIEWANWIVTEN